jgi:hypothetical protein
MALEGPFKRGGNVPRILATALPALVLVNDIRDCDNHSVRTKTEAPCQKMLMIRDAYIHKFLEGRTARTMSKSTIAGGNKSCMKGTRVLKQRRLSRCGKKLNKLYLNESSVRTPKVRHFRLQLFKMCLRCVGHHHCARPTRTEGGSPEGTGGGWGRGQQRVTSGLSSSSLPDALIWNKLASS